MTDSKQTNSLSPVKVAVVIFIVALTLRMAYVLTLEIDAPIRADAAKYVTIAYNLVASGVYSHERSENPQPNSFITPGYPLYLASLLYLTKDVDATYKISLNIQAFLGALTVLLAYFLALRMLPLWASIVVGVLAAISPHLIVTTGYLLTETLFSFFLILSMLLLVIAIQNPNKKLFFTVGVLVCCAALIRPIAMLLPLVCIWIIIISKQRNIKRPHAVMAVATGFILLWSPWAIWSSIHPATQSNVKGVFAYGTYPDFIYKDTKYKGYPNREDPEYSKMSKDVFYTLNILKERIAEEPFKYMQWYFFWKPVSYWDWSMIQGMGGPFIYPVKKTLYDKSSVVKLTYTIMQYLHYFLIWVMFIGMVYSLLIMIKKKDVTIYGDGMLMVLLVLAYATAVHSLLASLPRYSIPFQYFMYIAALFFLMRLFNYVLQQSNLRRYFGPLQPE